MELEPQSLGPPGSAGLRDDSGAQAGLVWGNGLFGSRRPIEGDALEARAQEVEFPGPDGAFVAADDEATVAHRDPKRRDPGREASVEDEDGLKFREAEKADFLLCGRHREQGGVR